MIANIVIIAIIVIAVAIVAKNYIANAGHSDCCGTDAPVRPTKRPTKDASSYTHAYDVAVEGMSCENCATRIANAFCAQEGLTADVDLAAGIAHVRASHEMAEDTLRRIVRNEGYGVGKISEV